MEKLIVNGVAFDFDIADADDAERYDKAMNYVVDMIGKYDDGASAADVIRHQCRTVMDAIDTALGTGAAKQLFGDRVNIRTCMGLFNEFVQAVGKQRESLEEMSAEIVHMYSSPSPVKAEK